jgi:membrane-associated phospholipid phosphatase
MRNAITAFYNRKITFYAVISFVAIGSLFLLLYEKELLHLMINHYHHPIFDLFFKYATYLGDGIVFFIVIVILLIFKRKYATVFIISGLTTLIISYVLKNWVFVGFARPFELIGDSLHVVEGVKMRHWHSFPSGHTTSAFALFVLVNLFIKNKLSQVFFVLLAIIAALSRVYLSQHFLQDIIGGAVLGTSIALVSYQLSTKKMFLKKKALDKSKAF